MADVVLGCDRNNGNDSAFQNAVAKVLENAGHKVEKLQIHPNTFASYSYSGKAKGKIGVFLIAAGLTAIVDLYSGNTNFKYAYFGIRGDVTSRMSSINDFNTHGIGKDWHGDCAPAAMCNKLAGKPYPEINKIVKSKCQAVFGKTGEEMGKNILSAMGGGDGSSSSSGSGSISTIKKCIQELLYPWNGDVYCCLRGDDTIHIGRIPGPTSTKLSLVEGNNVYLDGISVTDIDPETPNKLVVKWNNTEFVLKDDARIKRFGVKEKTIEATLKSEKDVVDFAYREWNKLLKDSGRVLECRVDGSPIWHIGNWVRVYIPTFNLNGYMYLTKVSHDDAGEWNSNLTLLDYPPDLGTEPSQTADDSDTDTDTDSDSDSEEE